MKTKQLFWGFLLLTIGGLFLFEKFALIQIEWSFVWDFWPLILVFWGISVLTKGTAFKPIVSALFGVFFGMMLYGTIFSYSIFNFSENDNYQTNSYSEPFDSATTFAEFNLNAGAGKFIIKGETDKLIDIYSKGVNNNYTFFTRRNDSTQFANLTMDNVGIHVLPHKVSSKLNIRLNSIPIWDFSFNVGASASYFDLSSFKVKNLELNTGASKADLKLGNNFNNTRVRIEMGAATLKIRVPRSSGCELQGDMVMVAKHLTDFHKITSEHYETSNFNESENKIFIHIDGGVAKLAIVRY